MLVYIALWKPGQQSYGYFLLYSGRLCLHCVLRTLHCVRKAKRGVSLSNFLSKIPVGLFIALHSCAEVLI